MKDQTYQPNPYDTTTNANLLVPDVVFMELKCKRPDERAVTFGRDEVCIHLPRCPYMTRYEPARWVFTPMTQPQPAWVIIRGFHVGSYTLEAFTALEGGVSLLMWDLAGQSEFRAGETIHPAVVVASRA